MPTTFRYLIFALAVLAALPLLVLVFLIPSTSISFIGIIYLLSGLLIVIGMISARWWSRRSVAFVVLGSSLAFITLVVRILFPPFGSQIHIITLPSQSGPRVLNRIFNEQDVVLFGARLGPYIGLISPSEGKALIPAFSQTFQDVNSHGATPLSPFLTTYLGQQRPDQFDVVIAEPKPGTTPRTGIIFLHGYGDNFTLQCWLIAKAGYRIDALTVCPSTDVNAHWWNSQGESIL